MEVLREGYRIPFLSRPPLSAVSIPMPSYNPSSTKGVALGEVTQALIAKDAVELAPLHSPGFYSRLFVVWKTSGPWRPVIDLSTLNHFVDLSHFRRPSSLSCFQSVRGTGWLPSISRRLTYRFPSIRNLAHSSALWHMAVLINSQRCALASLRPRRFSPGSWLLFPSFSIPGVFACFDTSTTGWSSHPPASLTSRWYWTSVGSWALSSTRRIPISSPLMLFSI